MIQKHFLTVGYIRPDTGGERVVCGDPDSSGTYEATFVRDDTENTLELLETGDRIDITDTDWFSETDDVWKKIIKLTTGLMKNASVPKPQLLGHLWQYFMDEGGLKKGMRVVAEGDDGAEFDNPSNVLGGKNFIRYQYQEGDEYFNEKVILLS